MYAYSNTHVGDQSTLAKRLAFTMTEPRSYNLTSIDINDNIKSLIRFSKQLLSLLLIISF